MPRTHGGAKTLVGRTVLAALWLLLTPLVPAASAQEMITSADSVSCSRCKLEAVRLVTLNPDSLAATLSIPLAVRRLSDGRYVAISGGWRPFLFNQEGGLIGLLGRKGKGPGEWENPNALFVGRADTIHMFDWSTARHSLWSAEGRFVRSLPMPPNAFRHVVYLADGSLVVSATVNTPANIGYPLHKIDTLGQISKSFGGEEAVTSPRDAFRLRRKLTRASRNRFWVSNEARLFLERYSSALETDILISGPRSWLPETKEFLPANPERAFTPRITAIQETASGNILVLAVVPDSNWKSGFGQPEKGPDGQFRPKIADYDKVYDSLVELIQVPSGRLLARMRLDSYILDFLDSSHVASYDEDSDGFPIVQIWRIVVNE